MKNEGAEFIANLRGCLNPKKRSSSSGKGRGCMARAIHVKRALEIGIEKWKEEVGYG